MPALGSIGVDASQQSLGQVQSVPALSNVRLQGQLYLAGLTKDSNDGNPSAPCMKITGPHRRTFLWPVTSGTRTISVDVKYSPDNGAGHRPKMIIKANAEVGITTDTTTEAPSDAGNTWVTIGPITINPNATGVIEVELYLAPELQTQQVTRWDNVVVT